MKQPSMIDLPRLPEPPFTPAKFRAWQLQMFRCGHEQTGNGMFVFLTIDTALSPSEDEAGADEALVEVVKDHLLWALGHLCAFTERLDAARGADEVAAAIGMRGSKTSARDARQAWAWMESAWTFCVTREAAEGGLAPEAARRYAADFLSHEAREDGRAPVSPEAVRKRIDRLLARGETAPSFPTSLIGQTSRK